MIDILFIAVAFAVGCAFMRFCEIGLEAYFDYIKSIDP